MSERIPTGIDRLDAHHDGGLVPGTITAMVASPASQYSALFYAFMDEREWVYVTTYRSAAAVKDELNDLLWWADVRVEHVGADRPLKKLHRVLESLDGERHVIVDTLTPLERLADERQYVHLLNGLKKHLLDTGRIALLHCGSPADPPALREVTLSVADVVWNLDVVTDADRVEHRLSVPKFRSTGAMEPVITLDLDADRVVEVSANVAD